MATETWSPTSTEEKSFKDAFSTLQTSIGGVVANVDKPEVPSRFVLDSRGYFDLRAYVMSGKLLPSTISDFQRDVPAKVMTELTDIDPPIYERSQAAMVGVGSTCLKYYNEELTKLVTAASTAIDYADNTIELLTVAEGMNLKYHLDILLQEKYAFKANQDATFDESREAAITTVALLKDDADSKKKNVDAIVEKLLTLRADTLKSKPEVSYVTKQFKYGPAENSSSNPNHKKPYLEQLNASYNAKIQEIAKKLEEARKTNAKWEEKTALAVGFSFWPGIGWIVMGVMAKEAAELKKAFDELQKQISEMQQANAEKMRFITKTSMMIEQCVDVEGKISAAIDAMKELSLLFLHQSQCYEKISFYLNAMDKGVRMESGKTRKIYVNKSLETTVTWLKDLKLTAQEFQKNIVREITLTA